MSYSSSFRYNKVGESTKYRKEKNHGSNQFYTRREREEKEIQDLLSKDQSGAFKGLLTSSLNDLLEAGSLEQLKAAPYERTEEHTDSRNGYRERELNTQIRTITPQVLRHRNQPFKTMIFENYSRSEAALIACMVEMVINGVSSKVVETLFGTSYSMSTVSDLCNELDKEVDAFRNWQLPGSYPFLTVDATYFKVRENLRLWILRLRSPTFGQLGQKLLPKLFLKTVIISVHPVSEYRFPLSIGRGILSCIPLLQL